MPLLTRRGCRTTLPSVGLGIIYALAGGLVWGFVPPLVKRGLVHSDVDAAVTVQQLAMVAFLLVVWIVGYGAGGLPNPLPAWRPSSSWEPSAHFLAGLSCSGLSTRFGVPASVHQEGFALLTANVRQKGFPLI